jgi:hypothetical protein
MDLPVRSRMAARASGFALVTILCALPVAALAQQTAIGSRVRGVVQDQSGAVVPHARVSLLAENDEVLVSTETDASGAFAFDNVPAGRYRMRAEFPGFTPRTVPLRLSASTRLPLQTLVLTVAGVASEITVGEARGAVSTAGTANKDAIGLDDSALRDLPIFDRDVIGAAARFLDPAALGNGGVSLVVDGMEARKAGVSPSAIQQIKVNQDPYSAEFARPGRGRIEVVTKSGTDAYHGSFDFTGRDAHLNARDPFAPTRPPEQRRIYEGVLGGPIANGKSSSFLVTLDRREEDLQAIVFADRPEGQVHAVVARPDRGVEASASVTHQYGKQQTFSVRFTGEQQTSRNQGVGGTTLAEAASDAHSDEEQIVVGHRWVVTARLLNEVRILAGRETQDTVGLGSAPRVVVLDAFTGGSAQSSQRQLEAHAQISQALTYTHGRHLLKAGFVIPDWSRRSFDDRGNREGTFTFGSLDDYVRGRPLSFSQQIGDGRLTFLQKVAGGFVQDQVSVNHNLTVSAGARYEWQNVYGDNNNVAPRASFAWAMGKRTVLRGGTGIFYERGGDGIIRDVLRSRDDRLIRILLVDPAYPDPFASELQAADVPRSLVTLVPDVRMPFTWQYGIGIERQVAPRTTMALSYLGAHGTNQFRSRDVNAPRPPDYAERPDPAFGSIRQIESNGRQQTHSVQINLRGQWARHLQGTAQYTLAFAHNDTSGINALPSNNYDLFSEWGRADFDQRHKFEALGTFKGGPWFNLGASVSLATGRPYSLRTGTDDYHSGQANTRPPGTARNSLQGPGYASVDLRWSRAFRLTAAEGDEHPAFSIRLDAFNVTNHVNYGPFVGTLTSPFFGRAIAALPPRRIQFSAGVTF